MKKIKPVILCGGVGSRLWPLSRRDRPKQFIRWQDDAPTLFEQAVTRVKDRAVFDPPMIICSGAHRFLVRESLRVLGVMDASLICEPAGRNTAPAIAAAIIADNNPESLMLIMPADHAINDISGFISSAQIARAVIESRPEKIVTFGISPLRPHTGYGYIERGAAINDGGAYNVLKFHEKPDAQTAETYCATGAHYWNSGIFMFKAAKMKDALAQFAPQILKQVQAAANNATHDLGDLMLDEAAFTAAPALSLDYAVMEKTEHAAVIPARFDWDDMGSWESICSVIGRDKNGNAISGDVASFDVNSSYIYTRDHMVCVQGLDDLLVVGTPDVTLVTRKDNSQNVGKIMEQLCTFGLERYASSQKSYRPWGFYEVITDTPLFKVKKLSIDPGHRLSLQKHQYRSEHWVVIRGIAGVTRDDDFFELQANQSVYIPCGAVHRLENKHNEVLEIIEIQTGTYFGEDDIIRLQDDYNRDKKAEREN